MVGVHLRALLLDKRTNQYVCSQHTTNLPTLGDFASVDMDPVLATIDDYPATLDQAVPYKVKFIFKLIFNLNLGSDANSDSKF